MNETKAVGDKQKHRFTVGIKLSTLMRILFFADLHVAVCKDFLNLLKQFVWKNLHFLRFIILYESV